MEIKCENWKKIHSFYIQKLLSKKCGSYVEEGGVNEMSLHAYTLDDKGA